MTGSEEHLARAEELLVRLDERREELERLAAADDVVAQIAGLAKEIEAELTRARSLADADA
jgi:hypothetical protein